MDDGIWLTLPSNASMDIYPNNTLQRYTTRLSSPMNLHSSYEVALAQISFPNSFSRDSAVVLRSAEEEARILTYELIDLPEYERLLPLDHSYLLPCTHGLKRYTNLKKLMKALNKEIKAYRTSVKDKSDPMADSGKDLPRLDYNQQTHNYVVLNDVSETHLTSLYLGPKLASRFGFYPNQFPSVPLKEEEKIITNNPVKEVTENAIQSVYVYSSIIQPQYVGDSLVPLLRMCPVVGKMGDLTSIEFRRLHYYPLQNYSFQHVEISLVDDTGSPIEFANYGRTVCVLHLRQLRR
jgi:hypothetical protein